MNCLDTNVDDLIATYGDIYLQQATSRQDQNFKKLLDFSNSVEETDNGYAVNGVKVARRVTEVLKDWYSNRFADKELTKSEFQQAIYDLKAEKGTAGHNDIE